MLKEFESIFKKNLVRQKCPNGKALCMGGTGNILDYIEAIHAFFIEMLVYVLTEFVTSLNASHISNIEFFFKVEVWVCGDIKNIH